ncbi:hypothetical protein G6F68_015135 [Rhizopus microsporus]|nr:hypothetical protein G6F68_015135 [Rhizopus microsporus]
MEALDKFTFTPDESSYHIVTASIEIAGAPCLPAIVSALAHVRHGHSDGLKASLETIEGALKAMNVQLPRMFERLDPGVFYGSIRPYLSGWKPKGLIYEACSDLRQSLAGASAAQSCLIAVLDVALGVVHLHAWTPPGLSGGGRGRGQPTSVRAGQQRTGTGGVV